MNFTDPEEHTACRVSTKIPHLAGAQRPTAAAAAEVLPLSFWVTIMTGDPSGRAAHGLARTRFLIGDPEMFAGVATSYPPIPLFAR